MCLGVSAYINIWTVETSEHVISYFSGHYEFICHTVGGSYPYPFDKGMSALVKHYLAEDQFASWIFFLVCVRVSLFAYMYVQVCVCLHVCSGVRVLT